MLVLSSPAPTSTDDDFLPKHSSSTKEIGLLASLSAKPHPTHSFAHHVLYTHSFTPSFYDTPSLAIPTGLTSPHDSPHRDISHHNHKSLVVVIFAAIGGTIALFFLAFFTRQAITYSRLPRQNMELTSAAREELVQEMAGIADRRRQSFMAPPPYERAPPYEPFSPHQPV